MKVRLMALSMLVIGAAGCTQPDEGEPTAQRSPGDGDRVVVTLGNAGCEVQAATEVAAGPLRVELLNTTDGRFDLDLWRLDDGREYDELAAHVAEEMRRIKAGEEPLGHPDFAELIAEATADGASGELRTDLAAGTYGFACISFATPERPSGIWAAGPMQVPQGPS